MENTRLDRTDFIILRALVRDGRISFARLGELAALSPHGAADRVRRLRASGVITGFTARVDLGQVGRSLDAYIDIRLMPSTDPDAFERAAGGLQAVREIVFVTGRFDYQVRVACTGAEELDRTVRALRQDGGAAQTETRIVLRRGVPPDEDAALALEG